MQETIDLKARLFQALSQSGAMDLQALSSFLNLEAATLQPLLQDLCREGQLVLTRKGRYAYPSQLGLVTGVVQGHRRGFGFLIRSDGEPDLYIASDAMNGALNGDTVLARPLPGERRECEVQTVLARANEVLVGRFELDGADGFVVPDDGRICVDIRIPQRDAGSAKDGDKVLARITAMAAPPAAPPAGCWRSWAAAASPGPSCSPSSGCTTSPRPSPTTCRTRPPARPKAWMGRTSPAGWTCAPSTASPSTAGTPGTLTTRSPSRRPRRAGALACTSPT